jgi:hypothetical protein
MKPGRLSRLHPGAFADDRTLLAENLLRRVLAPATTRADTEALAQVIQAAPKLGAVANLAFGHGIADADIHITGDITIE